MPPKEIFDWIEIKWMFLGFAVTFGLRNFHRGGEMKWAYLKNHSITVCDILWIASYCQWLCASRRNFDRIKIKWILRGSAVSFWLGNFHRGGEVKWTFLKNYLITFCNRINCFFQVASMNNQDFSAWIWYACYYVLILNYFRERLAVPLLHPRGVYLFLFKS